MKSIQNNTLTAVKGISVGHYTETLRPTGCTVVLCPQGAVAGVDVRGAAPGTRDTDALSPSNTVTEVHGILLSGGSAFGLDAAGGVMRYLEERGYGFQVGRLEIHNRALPDNASRHPPHLIQMHFPQTTRCRVLRSRYWRGIKHRYHVCLALHPEHLLQPRHPAGKVRRCNLSDARSLCNDQLKFPSLPLMYYFVLIS